MINEFIDDYFFLSNFYPCNVKFEGIIYPHSESAFQAQKCITRVNEFLDIKPGKAKRLGAKVPLREDWDKVKDNLMYLIVKEKFIQNPDLLTKLLATGNEELVEGTTWNDRYWGIDLNTGIGLNKLGKILMKIREELKNA